MGREIMSEREGGIWNEEDTRIKEKKGQERLCNVRKV